MVDKEEMVNKEEMLDKVKQATKGEIVEDQRESPFSRLLRFDKYMLLLL